MQIVHFNYGIVQFCILIIYIHTLEFNDTVLVSFQIFPFCFCAILTAHNAGRLGAVSDSIFM